MALSCFVGSLVCPAAIGNKAVTGVGFQPKVVLFFGQLVAADSVNNSGSTNISFKGVATDSTHRGTVDLNDDFSTTSLYANPTATTCIRYRNSSGTVLYAADFVSMDADGFTVNFGTVTNTSIIINFLAIGGSDLSNATVQSFTTATASGAQAITGVGFKPDCIFLLGSASSTIGAGYITTPIIGIASGPTARGSTDSCYDASTSATYQRTNKVYSEAGASNAVRRESDLTSFDSDGFTLNWSTVVVGSSETVFALCLKGGQFQVGSLLQKTSPGTQQTATTFQPTGVLLLSAGNISNTSPDATLNENNQMVGAASSTTARAMIYYDDGPSNGVGAMLRTKVYASYNPNGTPSVRGRADLSSFDATPGFTLNFDTADAVAREVLFLTFGSSGNAPTVPSMDWLDEGRPTQLRQYAKVDVVTSGSMPGKGLN